MFVDALYILGQLLTVKHVSGLREDAQIGPLVTDRGRHGEGFSGQEKTKFAHRCEIKFSFFSLKESF
jgi:hypothetical protein